MFVAMYRVDIYVLFMANSRPLIEGQSVKMYISIIPKYCSAHGYSNKSFNESDYICERDHIRELHEVQQREGVTEAIKLTTKHIEFHQQKALTNLPQTYRILSVQRYSSYLPLPNTD